MRRTTSKIKMKRIKPEKIGDAVYRQVWRLVEGGVRDTFNVHPEYLEGKTEQQIVSIKTSLTKRITGVFMSYVTTK